MKRLFLIVFFIICFIFSTLSGLKEKYVFPLKEGNVWVSQNPDIELYCSTVHGFGEGKIILEDEIIEVGVRVFRGRYLRFFDMEEYNKNGESVENIVLEGTFKCDGETLKIYLTENNVLDSTIKTLKFEKQNITEN